MVDVIVTYNQKKAVWLCFHLFFFVRVGVLCFKSWRVSFRVVLTELAGLRGSVPFYQTLGYANIIMKIDYCFYRVKPTAVIMCLYFPFTLLLCCDWS